LTGKKTARGGSPTRKRTDKKSTKTDRAIANAERLARMLLAAPPASDTPLAPPAFLTDKRLAPALQFWKEHAPQFIALGTLEQVDRFSFAMLCVYAGEFIAAEDDILASGYSVMVKTISGDKMPRENPSVARRDFAAGMILQMSKSFGLTKLDRLNLSRLNAKTPYTPSMFPEDRDQEQAGARPGGDDADPEAKNLRDLLSPRLN
jgi:phage terminase small subunit